MVRFWRTGGIRCSKCRVSGRSRNTSVISHPAPALPLKPSEWAARSPRHRNSPLKTQKPQRCWPKHRDCWLQSFPGCIVSKVEEKWSNCAVSHSGGGVGCDWVRSRTQETQHLILHWGTQTDHSLMSVIAASRGDVVTNYIALPESWRWGDLGVDCSVRRAERTVWCEVEAPRCARNFRSNFRPARRRNVVRIQSLTKQLFSVLMCISARIWKTKDVCLRKRSGKLPCQKGKIAQKSLHPTTGHFCQFVNRPDCEFVTCSETMKFFIVIQQQITLWCFTMLQGQFADISCNSWKPSITAFHDKIKFETISEFTHCELEFQRISRAV